ncbi:MAG: AsmA family protein [Parvibaculaceae bacterium]|nr:AsmA family protein [Parvibaculaceae bacterium]
MNSILTYIAGLLVALLFAALVGPSLIDWNEYRAEIEAQASEATGRPVKIDGDIRFRVLPAPQMTLNRVRVGHVQQASALPSDLNFATFEAIDAEVALAPLLTGDIKVTSIILVRPRINLEILPDGTPNWRGIDIAERIPANGMFSLASISLDRARFEDGVVNYRNRSNGRSWRAEKATGEIVASSLLGPLRADVEAVVSGVPVAMRLGLGAFGGHKAFQVALDVETTEYPAQFLFSGIATEFSMAGRLDGNGRLRIGGTKGQGDAAPIRLDAGMVVNARRADFRNLALAANGATANGSGRLRWEGRPRFALDLAAESFVLDPLLAQLAPAESDKAPLLDLLLASPVPNWLDGEVKLAAKTLLVRDVPLREAALDLALKDGVINLNRAAAELGGATEVDIKGEIVSAEENSSFLGEARLSSRNIAGLAAWLAPSDNGEAARPAIRGRPLAARAKLDFRPGTYRFDDVALSYGGEIGQPSLRGRLAWQTDSARPFIRAALDIEEFDFDPLIALLPEGGDPFPWFDARDMELKLDAKAVTIFRQEMKDAHAEMALRSGMLSIARFDIADISGATVALTGELDGVTAGTSHDVKGRFSGSIKAERFGGLLALGGFDVPDVEGPVDIAVTGTSGEADDSDLRVDTLTLQGTVRGSRVDGVIKRRHGPRGGVDRLEISGHAANDNGRVLLEQLGLSPRKDLSGAGNVSVQLDGETGGDYDANFRVNIGGTTLTARGKVEAPFKALRFTGRADIAASGVMHVLGGFGAPENLAHWVGRQAAGPGFVLSSDVVWDKKSLALSDLETVAGSFRVSGNAVWSAGENGKLPNLAGTLETNGIDLTPLVVDDEEDDTAWPASALDWSALGAFESDVEVKSGSLVLGRLSASDLATRISVSHGVLTASPLTANFARGRLSAGVRVEGGSGQPGIGVNLLLENAALRDAVAKPLGGAPGDGRLDVNAQLQGQGRSWLALVSSMSGTMNIALSDLRLSPLDLSGFGTALRQVQAIEAFPDLVEATLFTGETAAEDLALDLAVENGVMRVAAKDMKLEGGSAELDLVYDLPRLAADAAMSIWLAEPQGAPEFLITATSRSGQAEVQAETLELQNFVARRLLQRSLDETGAAVPQDLRELMELPVPADGAAAMPLARPVAN